MTASCGPPWGPAAGLWESFRIHSYDAGDYYNPHRDNCCRVGDSAFFPTCRSFRSLLLYLKDSTDGCGATRFHLSAGERALVRDVVPRAGRAVVFDHSLVHESLPAGECRKYIARSDVMFAPPVAPPESETGTAGSNRDALEST